MIIQIYTSKSAKEVIHYFIGSQTLEEYYSKDNQEFAGNWGGKGAAMLGLTGVVRDKDFGALCNNLHPVTGEQLTPRMRGDRRPGFDVTFNVPKSVSLVYAWTKDERIIWALRQTVHDVALLMQEEAATRDRANGRRDGDRKTGVLVSAEYVHLTARPQGGIPDPHLHCHLYIPNLTWDGEEGRWKALQMGRIHDKADHYNWIATHYLAANLRSIGLEIIPTKDAFEIAGIEKEFRDKFSRRTQTIEEEAIKRGITDPAQKAKLAVMTRERKSKGLHISEIEPYWWGNLLPEERRALESIAATLKRSRASELSMQMVAEQGAVRSHTARERAATASRASLGQKDAAWAERNAGVTAGRRVSMNKATAPSSLSTRYAFEANDHDRKAVALGMEHVFERKSAVPEDELVTEALKTFCVGKASVAGVRNVMAEAPLIRREHKGEMYVTTAEVVAEEDRIVDQCIFGKGRFEAINAFWKIRDEELNSEQKNAVLHVLNSQDFITGIAGNPGVGKTRILQEIKRGIEGGYQKVLALAPWGVTAHEVLRKDGFENAETVAKLLTSERMQAEAHGAVWLVDEAGLLSAREMDRLIALAQELGARLVFVGDAGQHHAVERGQAFDLLQKAGQMDVAEVTEIQRQKGDYKRVVELVIEEKTDEAISLLKKMGNAHEMTLAERKIALAKDYVSAIEKGETALVVAPTHAECKDVTEGIRAALKAKGFIKPAGQKTVMEELAWTEDQKSDPQQYKRGLLVEINSPVKGYRVGEKLEVVGVRGDMVRVRGIGPHATKSKPLPLAKPESFSVHEQVVKDGCQWEVLPASGGMKMDQNRRCESGSS